ncbi:MAG: response regulator [Acidobacteriota bacterium]
MSWLKDLLQTDHRLRVLAITSSDPDRAFLEGIAGRAHWDLKLVSSCEAAVAPVRHQAPAVILCDRDLPGTDWREAVRYLREHLPASAIIILAAEMDDRFWLEVIQRGGYDVVTRPLHEHRVVATVRQASLQPTK